VEAGSVRGSTPLPPTPSPARGEGENDTVSPGIVSVEMLLPRNGGGRREAPGGGPADASAIPA